MDLVFPYTKKRKDFGRHPNFTVTGPEMLVDIASNPAMQAHFTPVPLSTVAVQCAPEMSEHEANTESFSIASRGMLHKEGGWPKDIDPNEIDHLNMFRKKVERDDVYISAVKSLTGTTEELMKQNDAIDIAEHYFDDVVPDRSQDITQPRCLLTLKDPNKVKRSAAMISWHPDERGRIAVAYAVSQFQRQPGEMSPASYIWDLENPNMPITEMQPVSPLVSLQFNYKDTHIIVGGSYNGVIWPLAYESSPIEKCHRDPVYKVQWLQSKTAMELASVSTDGRVMWWDLRRMAEPTEVLDLVNKADGSMLGGVSLDYDPALGPSKFMVGTEQGLALLCNRKAKSAAEKIAQPFPGHYGPVYAIQRNPFHSRFFMTIGDWAARVWADDVRTPIVTMPFETQYLTTGCWSPTRPGVFFTAMRNGFMGIWDMAAQQKAVKDWKISDAAITSMEVHTGGSLLSAGSADGSVAVYELCEGLAVAQSNEKAAVQGVFEREAKREKNIEARVREQRLKEKQKPEVPVEIKTRPLTDKDTKEIEEDFLATIGPDEDHTPIPLE
ncbi:putative Dynein intermediate chain 2; axonemal [Paratrimastix pyriformis]|uniref:Dynein intermediate chain 2 n=1 Tax=Paratrimastix pyriformis TaxID=342808 RepID=A0ABQ8UHD0_9EUKA|nr:putative Dynein intermediate chain 2; axonemal [Paratrimastix pyriformis]